MECTHACHTPIPLCRNHHQYNYSDQAHMLSHIPWRYCHKQIELAVHEEQDLPCRCKIGEKNSLESKTNRPRLAANPRSSTRIHRLQRGSATSPCESTTTVNQQSNPTWIPCESTINPTTNRSTDQEQINKSNPTNDSRQRMRIGEASHGPGQAVARGEGARRRLHRCDVGAAAVGCGGDSRRRQVGWELPPPLRRAATDWKAGVAAAATP
jgi:hypothetical protein